MNPPPVTLTAEHTQPIVAIALQHRIDWTAFEPPAEWRERHRYPYGRSWSLADGSTLFLFGLGAAVVDGAERVPAALRLAIAETTGHALLDETEETYHIVVDATAAATSPRIGWDRVVIPARQPELVAAVALLLAQSAALERYDFAANALLDESLSLSRALAMRGGLPHSTGDLVTRVGRLTRDRLELARWFFLVDRPENTWTDARVAQLYDGLFENLELKARHDAVLHKLGAAERATQTTLDLWQGRRSNALEWAIVLLIVLEIVLSLIGR